MTYLITGANGFIASNLINHLSKTNKKINVIGLTRSLCDHNYPSNVKICEYNPSNENEIYSILKEYKPKKIFHFAAQSNPSFSWVRPEFTIDANYKLSIYILNSIVKLNSSSHLYMISSSSIYRESQKAITENDTLDINTPYALSKIIQENLSDIYQKKYNVKTTIIRPFCISGPGKTGDVISDWSNGIVSIEYKKTKKLMIGNLNGVSRDFLHIQDFINAFLAIVKSNQLGVFNICSGKKTNLSDLLELFLSKSNAKVKVATEKSKLRNINDSILFGDNTKIKKLGWTQELTLSNIVEDQLNFYRKQLQ